MQSTISKQARAYAAARRAAKRAARAATEQPAPQRTQAQLAAIWRNNNDQR